MPSTTTTSGFSAGRFLIELDGVRVGVASSVQGGDLVGEIVREAPDAAGLVKKHVSNVRREPLTVTVGFGMGKGLADWVSAFTARTSAAKDGAVVFLDHDGSVRSRLEWTQGLITQVQFPGCESADTDTGEITITIELERARTVAGGAAPTAPTAGLAAALPTAPDPWPRSRFRVRIDGITNDTGFVTGVEPFIVRRPPTANQIGIFREGSLYGPQEVSDLLLTLPEAHAADFDRWLKEAFIDGHHLEGDERTGTLEYLGPALQVLATLTFSHVGLIRVERQRTRSGNGVTAQVCVRLDCEQVTFACPAAQPAPATPTEPATAPTPAGMISEEAVLAAARRLLAALDPRHAPVAADGPVTAEALAARLLATAAGEPAPDPAQQDGAALGRGWAAGRASLAELAGLLRLDRPDWTAITLPRGHSLITDLREAGVLPATEQGPIELQRGPLLEGVLAGIGEIGAQIGDAAGAGQATSRFVQTLLDQHVTPTAAPAGIARGTLALLPTDRRLPGTQAPRPSPLHTGGEGDG
jgi:hypothetical protein